MQIKITKEFSIKTSCKNTSKRGHEGCVVSTMVKMQLTVNAISWKS